MLASLRALAAYFSAGALRLGCVVTGEKNSFRCASGSHRLVPVTLCLLACSRSPGAAPVTGSASAAPAPVSSPIPPTGTAPEADADAKAVVERWDALNRRKDAKGLEGLYAEMIDFYGQKLTKARVVALKTAAFEKTQDFTQSIAGLRLATTATDRVRADFTKTWTQGGVSKSTAAVLELTRVGTSFKVTTESDASAENLKAVPQVYSSGPAPPGLCSPRCGANQQCVLGRVVGAQYEPTCVPLPPPDTCSRTAAGSCPTGQKCCHVFANGCLGGWCPSDPLTCNVPQDCGD